MLTRFLSTLRGAYCYVRRPLTVGVRGAVLDARGRILLVRHTYMEGWYLPGGGVERRESLEAAVRRELWEEVGVTFEDAPLLFGVYSNFSERKSDHIVLFRVPEWQLTANPNGEIAEQDFFELTAPPPGTSPGTLRRLAELSGKTAASLMW